MCHRTQWGSPESPFPQIAEKTGVRPPNFRTPSMMLKNYLHPHPTTRSQAKLTTREPCPGASSSKLGEVFLSLQSIQGEKHSSIGEKNDALMQLILNPTTIA
jgi:hypothetical protein